MNSDGTPLVSFAPLDGERDVDGVRVRDEVMDLSVELWTDAPVSPCRVTTGRFHFPVDAAVAFEATEIRIPSKSGVWVKDESGEDMGEVPEERIEFPRGTYYLNVNAVGVLYVKVFDASFSARNPGLNGGDPAEASFAAPTRVAVGYRSTHDRPGATITVPDDPTAMMTAVSHLGSSIKEFSCERSWPTIRGHPPAIERGDELDVPPALAVPETGVTIAVPPTYADVYRVAPLSFYLGARVVPGDEPELRTDAGFSERLARGRSLEAGVDRLLARCFLLDTLTRIGGYYSNPRQEYDRIASHLPFYPEMLYDRPIDAQLLEYLEVSMEDLAACVPRWPVTATLRPRPEDVETLPFLLDSLARVHVDEGGAERSADAVADGPTGGSGLAPSVFRTHAGGDPPAGEGVVVPAAFEHALSHALRPAAEQSVVFVGSDPGVADALSAVLTDDENRDVSEPFDVTVVEERPTADALASRLREDVGFLHYDGPAEGRGLVCADGTVTVEDVGEVGASMVSVGGCRDPTVPADLVEAGAVAGVYTPGRGGAVRAPVGRVAGRLLSGYTLAASAALAGFPDDAPHRFVGDASRALTRREGGTVPYVVDVETVAEDEHRVSAWPRWSDERRLGTVSRLIEDYVDGDYQLVGARLDQPVRLSTDEVVDLLNAQEATVRLNGDVFQGEATVTAAHVRASRRRTRDGRTRPW